MRRKSILEEVEEQEKRRKESENLKKTTTIATTIISLLVGAVVLYGLYAIFKPKELTAEEQAARDVQRHTASFKYDCEREIKSRLKSPDSYKQKRVIQNGDYEGVIAIQYTAKNSFGVELQEQAVCTYNYDGIVNIRM